MNIIIVGCGKVGYTLVEQLNNEDHDVVVVDERPEKLQGITDNLDAMGVLGNGMSHGTLLEAGITTADLLIAVTGDDEKNLLCCLIAKKTGHCQTIARVRNPIYNEEIAFLKKEFGLAMIINPEQATAMEIAQIFQFPSAIRVDSFAKGHMSLLHFRIGPNSPLIGLQLFKFHQTMQRNVLVCTVIRGDEVIIPNGDFQFAANDIVAIASERRNALEFFRKIGAAKNRVGNAILAGGGKVSFYLAKMLLHSGIDVTIIEINRARCESLSEQLPKATIICGDATDQSLLMQEGLANADGFAALTGLDEENIPLPLCQPRIECANRHQDQPDWFSFRHRRTQSRQYCLSAGYNLGLHIEVCALHKRLQKQRVREALQACQRESRGAGIYHQRILLRLRHPAAGLKPPQKHSDRLYLPQRARHYPQRAGYDDGGRFRTRRHLRLPHIRHP